jgi:hypothetical protein
MEKLISMTDFVLKQFNDLLAWKISEQVYILHVSEYAKFFSQPLQLGFFIPTDLDGNVLEEPKAENYSGKTKYWAQDFREAQDEYKKARERVLFEGFEVKSCYGQYESEIANYPRTLCAAIKMGKWKLNDAVKTIEDLTDCDLTLTASAKKQIGL